MTPGSFVRLKTDPSRAGILQPGGKTQAGQLMVPVQFPDGQVTFLPHAAIELVPIAPESLVDLFAAGRFVAPDWLRRVLARLRVTGRLSDLVYSMEATETDFYAYQFKPVLKLLNSPTDGLLVADEVGLGKTIEAGLIWTELRARIESNRLLVICPKTLCHKWQTELDRRFGVDARIVDATELLQLVDRAASGTKGFAAIASMQSLRPPKNWRLQDQNVPTTQPRLQLAQLLDSASEQHPLFDLLVIDEAHHMRNPDTLLFDLGQLLNAVAAHRVFLSATPVHLQNRDLHSLLRLIDPETFEYESTVDDLIQANAPLIAARDLVLKPTSTPDQILACLSEAQEHPALSGSKTIEIVTRQIGERSLDRAVRADLAARLEHANQLANYINRTRRKDVQEFRVLRKPKAPEVEMAPVERQFYEKVSEEVASYAEAKGVSPGFLLSMPQRMLTSSPAATSEYWCNAGLALTYDAEESDDELEEGEADAKPLFSRLCELARTLGLSEDLAAADPKFKLLMQELRALWATEPHAKVLVFSSFKPTLGYLARRLKTEGINSVLFHGSVKEPRDVLLKRFRDEPDARVFLSSEVGSEGVDLQFSATVVNYDLPWNPMRLEQRIGRVDRLGQKKPAISVINLIYGGTIDQVIYDRLYVRLGLIERALGEFESVLGEPIRAMQQRLLDPELTSNEKQRVIDQTAQALENLRNIERKLEDEAGSLIRHGDYVLERIREAQKLQRWVSGDDVLVYVRDRLTRSFPGVTIDANPPASELFQISLTEPARSAFLEFAARRNLRGSTRLLSGDDRQRFRFTTSIVRGSEPGVENVSQVHPLVRFAAELDSQDLEERKPRPVAARVRSEDLSLSVPSGRYVVAIRSWLIGGGTGSPTHAARLAYAGADVGNSNILPADVAEGLVSAVAQHGRLLPNAQTGENNLAATDFLKQTVFPDLDRRFGSFVDEIRAEIDDRAAIRRRAVERHQESKGSALRAQIRQHTDRSELEELLGNARAAQRFSALASASEKKLAALIDRCKQRLSEIQAIGVLIPEEVEIAALLVEVVD